MNRGFINIAPTCHDVDHITRILGGWHILFFLVANECLEHSDRCTVYVSGDDANARMRGHRVLLQFLDEPIPLPLLESSINTRTRGAQCRHTYLVRFSGPMIVLYGVIKPIRDGPTRTH